jgi:hypothetical protein
MAERYLSQEDMIRYLDRSICMYDGVPVYVSAQRYPQINIYKLDGQLFKAWKIIDHTDEKFCDRSPLLGYINIERSAYYLQKMPIRNQHAGLRQNTMIAIPQMAQGPWFTSKAMEDCILGKHSKIDVAWECLRNQGWIGCAIHRHLAILSVSSRNYGLHYKGRLVALWSNPAERWEFLQNNDTSHLERIISKLGVL